MFITAHRAASYIVLAGLLAACAPGAVRPPPAPRVEAGPGFQEAHYRRAEAMGQTVLRIDPQRSLISITVHRGGSLARMGHDHVVASRTIEGLVAPEEGRTDFHFRLDQLTVDEPSLRAEAGFGTQPASAAIEGTRRNMLTKVLDSEHFPFVLIHATRTRAANVLSVSITLHGTTRAMEIPVQMERPAADASGDSIAVSGTLRLNQSDFGIVPFSVLGGAIAVQDGLDLRFRIVAAKR